MTLYFSHPAVEGIILWGFWDGRIWKANATLVEGPDLTVIYIHAQNTEGVPMRSPKQCSSVFNI